MIRRAILRAAAAALAATAAIGASAQEFPSKPIRIIVPNSAGTISDVIARLLANEMSKTLGQAVVVETKAGADSLIGTEYVARQAPADGYTLLLNLVSTAALLPWTSSTTLRFDPSRDLPPVIGIAEGRFVMGSPTSAPWKSYSEMVTQLRANPGKYNYGSAVPSVRLSLDSVMRGQKLEAVHVPYAAYAALQTALQQGDVHVTLVAEANLPPLGDKFRVTAVTGQTRLARFPDAPTFKELGFPQIQGISYSLNVRAGTPKAAVDKLHAAAAAALKQPEMKAQLEKLHLEVTAEPPEAAEKTLARAAEFYGGLARQAGLGAR